MCWHRAGRIVGRWLTCRHCGVAIEECPCVSYHRVVDESCWCCFGSGYVAIVRSYRAKLRELIG